MTACHVPDTTLGSRLKQAREYAGFSEEEAARYLGLPTAAISRIEVGAPRAGAMEIRRLAELYQIPLNTLVDHDSKEPGWDSFPLLD